MQEKFTEELLSQKCISVRIIANAKKNEIGGKMENGVWKIKIHAPAREGRANAEVVDFVQQISGKKIGIVSGHKGRNKKLQILFQ